MDDGHNEGKDHPAEDTTADADPGDGRSESLNERMDRNWIEMLQELRVTQTGTQILTGFLLSIAFQPTFRSLDEFQRIVYLLLVGTAVLTTALSLAPVNLHRGLFRRHAKPLVVGVAHVIVQVALAGVALVLVGTVLLIFDVVVGRNGALVAAGTTVLILVGLAALPFALRSVRSREASDVTPRRGP
jgi:uncharacterized membrane protein YqjE